MNQKDALTILVRRHRKEFVVMIAEQRPHTYSNTTAKRLAIRKLVGKYQKDYLTLRGKNPKGLHAQ